MISALKANPGEPNRDIVTEYFRKLEHPSQLMPGEQLEDLPLRFVPAASGQMRNLAAKLSEFGDGGMATAAFPPHAMDADMPEAQPKAQAPKPDPDKPALRGAIERVSVKHGPGKTGKPWTLYGICISGTWVNTFSSTIGQMAKDNEGQAVTLFYEAGEKGNNAVELVLADGTRHTAGE
jgi:hypothetical protein